MTTNIYVTITALEKSANKFTNKEGQEIEYYTLLFRQDEIAKDQTVSISKEVYDEIENGKIYTALFCSSRGAKFSFFKITKVTEVSVK